MFYNFITVVHGETSNMKLRLFVSAGCMQGVVKHCYDTKVIVDSTGVPYELIYVSNIRAQDGVSWGIYLDRNYKITSTPVLEVTDDSGNHIDFLFNREIKRSIDNLLGWLTQHGLR